MEIVSRKLLVNARSSGGKKKVYGSWSNDTNSLSLDNAVHLNMSSSQQDDAVNLETSPVGYLHNKPFFYGVWEWQ